MGYAKQKPLRSWNMTDAWRYTNPGAVWFLDVPERTIVFNDKGTVPLDTTKAGLAEEVAVLERVVNTPRRLGGHWRKHHEEREMNIASSNRLRRDRARLEVLEAFDRQGGEACREAVEGLVRRAKAMLSHLRRLAKADSGVITPKRRETILASLEGMLEVDGLLDATDAEGVRLRLDRQASELASIEVEILEAFYQVVFAGATPSAEDLRCGPAVLIGENMTRVQRRLQAARRGEGRAKARMGFIKRFRELLDERGPAQVTPAAPAAEPRAAGARASATGKSYKADLKRIHALRKEAGLDEAAYRDLLNNAAGVRSSAALKDDAEGRGRVIHALKNATQATV